MQKRFLKPVYWIEPKISDEGECFRVNQNNLKKNVLKSKIGLF